MISGLCLGWLCKRKERGSNSLLPLTEGWDLMFSAADAELRLNDIGREGVAASTKQ